MPQLLSVTTLWQMSAAICRCVRRETSWCIVSVSLEPWPWTGTLSTWYETWLDHNVPLSNWATEQVGTGRELAISGERLVARWRHCLRYNHDMSPYCMVYLDSCDYQTVIATTQSPTPLPSPPFLLEQDFTGLPSTGSPSTCLASGRRRHQDKEARGSSSVLVYSNNLLCLLTTLSTTYSRLVFKKYWSILFLNIFMHSSGNLFQSFTTLWENVHFLISNPEWHFTQARLLLFWKKHIFI